MSRFKKRKGMGQIYEENKIQPDNICKFQQLHSFDFSSPLPMKTANSSMFLRTTDPEKKSKRIFKNKKEKQVDPNTKYEKLPKTRKQQPNDNKFDIDKQSNQNCRNNSQKKVLTLQVNDDIKTYYELLDLTESLDALIIRYYKDPLLSTILMDSNTDGKNMIDKQGQPEISHKGGQIDKQQISNVKQELKYSLYEQNVDEIKIKLEQHQQQLSQEYQSELPSPKIKQYLQNQSNSENSSSLVEFKVEEAKIKIEPKLQQLPFYVVNNIEETAKDKAMQLNKQHQFTSQLKKNQPQKVALKSHEQLQLFTEQIISKPKLSDLNNWLTQIAIFVDKFSSQQFKKLFKLKQLLNSILRSVNKSVKKQLDQFYLQLQEKQINTNKGDNINIQEKMCKEEKNREEEFQESLEDEGKDKEKEKKQNGEDDHHVCRICWQYFVNGHQLGGHMSKKHPGHSLEYRNKQLIKTRKVIERQRRLYFRMIRSSVTQFKETKILKRQRKFNVDD